MKLSKNTLTILKNFASINPSIYLQKGKNIRTKSLNNIIYAEAKIDDEIIEDMAIYDLGEFLNTLGLFGDNAVLEPNPTDMKVKIKNERSHATYTIHDPSLIVYPKKALVMPVADVVFELKNEDLIQLLKACSTMGLPEICITQVKGRVIIKALDPKDSAASQYSLDIAAYNGENEFEFFLHTDNLKMLKGDYKVLISKLGAAKFEGAIVNYVVATEASSKFK